jgi:hypothetical protein
LSTGAIVRLGDLQHDCHIQKIAEHKVRYTVGATMELDDRGVTLSEPRRRAARPRATVDLDGHERLAEDSREALLPRVG